MSSPIGGIAPVGIGGIGGIGRPDPAAAPAADGGEGFAAALAGAVDRLQGTQRTADGLAVQAATGDLRDVHDYMIASSEAKLATEMVVTVKNKAVEAFNEIMRMPV